ncbi:ABC transporter permease [Ferruginibacter yonginensis]|uniref:ABC transporter permease n=1 Tax=Ferruginibacter yonginensis TaxID=1310416 RepID=A0ABV8QME2_9BACT
MKNLIKKIVISLLVLPGVVALVFVMFQGFQDPTKMMVGQTGDQKTINNIRKALHLDAPKWQQFLYYCNDVSPIAYHSVTEIEQKQLKGFFWGGEHKIGLKVPYLGSSYQTKKPTTSVLAEALPATLILALTAMLFACFVGISLGVIAAIKKNTWVDRFAIITSIAGISAPSFFIAILIAYVFGFLLQPYLGLHITGSLYALDEVTGEQYLSLKNLILPAITLGIRPMAVIAQLTRSTLLEVLQQDYIRTAYAKGLPTRTIIFRHALKNTLNPVITAITGWFAELLAGAFFVEYIFGWKGLGKVTVTALEKLDYPLVSGAVLCSAVIFIAINILADVLYTLIDPRVRL